MPSSSDPISFETVLESQYSGIRTPRRAVIRDAEQWRAFVREATNVDGANPAAPAEVDFTREMAIVAAMGLRRSGGYSIAIENIFSAEGKLRVVVREVAPKTGSMTTQALTAPLVVVRLARSNDPVSFVERPDKL